MLKNCRYELSLPTITKTNHFFFCFQLYNVVCFTKTL